MPPAYRPTAAPYAVPPGPRPRYTPPSPHATLPPEVQRRVARGRAVAGVCLVVGMGLLIGAAAGYSIGGYPASAQPAAQSTTAAYAVTHDLWHNVPVDTLFPPTVNGPGAGPGGADRTWTRVGVAPDSDCDGAFDPALAKTLAPVGCRRLVRATYTDSTSSDVTTVGLLITRADPAGMARLSAAWRAQHLGQDAELMPRPVAFPGTDSTGFGLAQRASWQVDILNELPAVVYAVSGFADSRTVTDPQPAAAATIQGATSAPAQAGLGYDARGLTIAIEQRLVAATRAALHESSAGAAR